MTFVACNRDVSAGQGKLGLRMDKRPCRFPPCRIVTTLAICSERSVVPVQMTRIARLLQAQVRRMRMLLHPGTGFRQLDIRGSVALIALEGGMLSPEMVAGFCMIKRSHFDAKQVCFDAKVFLVATDARLILVQRVKAVFRGACFLDFYMAVQAFRAGDFVTLFMALHAIGNALQGSVNPCQLAGRNLSLGRRIPEEHQRDEERPDYFTTKTQRHEVFDSGTTLLKGHCHFDVSLRDFPTRQTARRAGGAPSWWSFMR